MAKIERGDARLPLRQSLLLPVAGAATYIAAHPPRRRPRRTPAALGLEYEALRIPAMDGTPLAAWWVPAAGKAHGVVLLSHGYACNREQGLPCLPAFLQAGYHALLYDFRAHGESAGRKSGLGHDEVSDLLGAVAWLEAHPDVGGSAATGLPIVAMGFSMGGAVSILGAAESPRITAVVADSVYPSLEQAVTRRGKLLFGPFSNLIYPPGSGPGGRPSDSAVRRVWRYFHKADADTVSPETAIALLSPRPVLLIHCGLDVYLAEQDVRALYDRAGDPRELWSVPAALHMRALHRSPAEYMDRVLSFLRRHGL